MNAGRLILREIAHRRLNFLLGVLSAAVAVGGLVAAVFILRKYDLRTERVIAAKALETQAVMDRLQDDMRKITLHMGFNVLILPKGQNLADLYADDFASRTMPEEYASRLAKSRVATINHVLPMLQEKIKWPEMDRTVLLTGVRGEVYVQSPSQKPLLEPVASGTIVLGSEIHRSLKLKAGDKVKLMGREFTVARLNAERGNKDDITVWVNLPEAQEMLNRKGLINGILALDCTCAMDRLSLIRPEIEKILPDTQVIELASQALARAEARQSVAAEAAAALKREKENRAQLRGEKERLAALLVPVAMIGSAIWIAVLAWLNVRERRTEIAILGALGCRPGRMLRVFLGRACLIGLAGALAGYAAGAAIGVLWRDAPGAAPIVLPLLDARLLLAVLGASVGLTLVASWMPALAAARQDPAEILREG